ncbi:hypothetical protein Tco_1459428 [Tanacetum coccineum]
MSYVCSANFSSIRGTVSFAPFLKKPRLVFVAIEDDPTFTGSCRQHYYAPWMGTFFYLRKSILMSDRGSISDAESKSGRSICQRKKLERDVNCEKGLGNPESFVARTKNYDEEELELDGFSIKERKGGGDDESSSIKKCLSSDSIRSPGGVAVIVHACVGLRSARLGTRSNDVWMGDLPLRHDQRENRMDSVYANGCRVCRIPFSTCGLSYMEKMLTGVRDRRLRYAKLEEKRQNSW